MSVDYVRIAPEELLKGAWEYDEFEGIGITAAYGGKEYLLVYMLDMDRLFEYQIQLARLSTLHKRALSGLAKVTEEQYYKVIEFISLKQISAVQSAIDITDTQRRLGNILQRVINMGASDLHITRNDVLADYA